MILKYYFYINKNKFNQKYKKKPKIPGVKLYILLFPHLVIFKRKFLTKDITKIRGFEWVFYC